MMRRFTMTLALVVALILVDAAVASATSPAPVWQITSARAPSNFAPGDGFSRDDSYFVTATNVGNAPTDGSVITISDRLPPGLSFDSTRGTGMLRGGFACEGGEVVTCSGSAAVGAGGIIDVYVPVDVALNATGTLVNAVAVTGGGARQASSTEPTPVSTAPAPFGFQSFDAGFTRADGSPAVQAGSHPYAFTTSYNTTTLGVDANVPLVGENPKDITFTLPPGLVGNPTAVPQCTLRQLQRGINDPASGCPVDAQVGVIGLRGLGVPPANNRFGAAAVFNMVPPPGEPAELGFQIFNNPVLIGTGVRTGSDYALTAKVADLTAVEPIIGSTLTLWGVPADPAHDAQRCSGLGGATETCDGQPGGIPATMAQHAESAPVPYLTLPTSCGRVSESVVANSWQHPGQFATASAANDANGQPLTVSGCNKLDFSPRVTVQPTTSVADSPAGLDIDLHLPQNDNPDGLAEGDLKNATVTLPAGVAVSPSSADGLGACSPQQIGIDTANEPSCPDGSKIGSVEVDTPLLSDALRGSVYLAQQGSNPFGSLLAIYVTAEADGVLIKLAGRVAPDPVTGQLTTTFDDNPQLPFSDFKLAFFGGPRAALATPENCGSYTSSAVLTPWSGTAPVSLADQFTIASGCVSGFDPRFSAGSHSTQAGASSPFVLSFSRSDTDEELAGLKVSLPPGLLAKVAGVPLCSDADANAGTCTSGSQVGSVTTGAGPGAAPLFLPGRAYLTGPYKGAPYGLAVVVPAKAGPFDLGNVIVRQSLHIDPTDAHVTATSDPFPTILQGIPLRIRRVDVTLDRSGFMINPTSCASMTITGTLTSVPGTLANVATPFQVGGCQGLGFSPKLAIALGGGRSQTKPGSHPSLHATLTQPAGQANIKGVKVALPLALALDPNNSQHVCDHDLAAAVHGGEVACPASTIVGTATAVTPLLPHQLSGNVYLVQGIRTTASGRKVKTLPTLLVPLRGADGVALDLRAGSAVAGGKLVTTFGSVPDAPVSSFKLNIAGGRSGILTVTGNKSLCKQGKVAVTQLDAQSGKRLSPAVALNEAGVCGRARKARAKKAIVRKQSVKKAHQK